LEAHFSAYLLAYIEVFSGPLLRLFFSRFFTTHNRLNLCKLENRSVPTLLILEIEQDELFDRRFFSMTVRIRPLASRQLYFATCAASNTEKLRAIYSSNITTFLASF